MAGYALGMGTALMGKEAAMACTVAVEDSIGTHYSDQLRSLLEDASRYPDDPGLIGVAVDRITQCHRPLNYIFTPLISLRETQGVTGHHKKVPRRRDGSSRHWPGS